MNITKNLKKIKLFIVAVSVLNIFHTLYSIMRIEFLSPKIPLWYSMPWGEMQLTDKANILALPILAWVILIVGVALILGAQKYHLRYGKEIISIAVFLFCGMLALSTIRIIFLASVPFEPLINPLTLRMLFLFILSLSFSYLLAPRIIGLMTARGIVTDPNTHKHPGMVLVKPSARGGGIIFALSFAAVALLFVPMSKYVFIIISASLITALLGFLDDVQNTQPNSRLKFLENPIVRLVSQMMIATYVVIGGIKIDFISNPFNGILFLNSFTFTIGGMELAPIAIIVTILWFTWIMNMLSWSNAIDGQYSGIMGIAGICLVFLALRPGFDDLLINKQTVAALGIIMAGASIGILPFNWHPSKIMWGFGATAAGLVFAALSVATRAKISASVFVILIPFLDGIIILIRRTLQGKFPLKADKEHLHHLLLERGWGIKKIAIFYWISTAVLGFISIMTADKNLPLVILTFSGVGAFGIILLNLKSRKARAKSQ